MLSSFCLTEPDAGSDAASLKTSAVRDGDSYILNGTKRFITNAPHAGIYTVMARTNPQSKAPPASVRSLSSAARPVSPWASPTTKWATKALTPATSSSKMRAFPASQLIGGVEGVGFKTAMKVLDKGRLHIAALSVGAAERMLEDALRYAMERKQFGNRSPNSN